ncbi:MAG TPA: hypothetical protein VGO96_16075 [Pyrinomonadaceae bacterium]|nr:hypothetical protein [Pyrinomonadaceae bacterium]
MFSTNPIAAAPLRVASLARRACYRLATFARERQLKSLLFNFNVHSRKSAGQRREATGTPEEFYGGVAAQSITRLEVRPTAETLVGRSRV